jgi:hypothetical protein
MYCLARGWVAGGITGSSSVERRHPIKREIDEIRKREIRTFDLS